jgi:hypothetical protein
MDDLENAKAESAFCEGAGDKPDILCGCGHPGCAGVGT